MSSKRTVVVTIDGREYKVRADGDGASVRRAAQVLEETMSKVRERSGMADSVDLAMLTALNLANSLVSERGQVAGGAASAARIAELADLAESALAAPSAS